MSTKLKLTEKAVIKCPHGGIVVLEGRSSTPSVTANGIPFINFEDLPGSAISGCKKCSPRCCKCTVVAGTSSGSSNMQVESGGVHCCIDIVGVVSNCGSALSLVSTGQSTVRTGIVNSAQYQIQKDVIDQSVFIEEEKILQDAHFNLRLLRKSESPTVGEMFKPLRPLRSYEEVETYYCFTNKCLQIKEKIIAPMEAYIYIRHLHDDSIEEYAIHNRGSLLAERLNDIYYKRGKYLFNAIPINKNASDNYNIKIVYSNIKFPQAKEKQKEAFDALSAYSVDIAKANKETNGCYIKDINSVNLHHISAERIKDNQSYDPREKKEDEATKVYPLSPLLSIEDPIGVVEDWFNYYEHFYKMAYDENDMYISRIKEENAYVYNVANQINYFYVNKEKAKELKTQNKELTNLYSLMIKEVCDGKLSSFTNKWK